MSSSHHHHHGRPPRDAAAEASAVRARLAWVRMARATFIGSGGGGNGGAGVESGIGDDDRGGRRPSATTSTSPGGGSGVGGPAGDRSIASQAIAAYSDILEELIADVAVEAHRAWRTGAAASSSRGMFPGVNLEGPTPPPTAVERASSAVAPRQQQQQQRAAAVAAAHGGGGGAEATAASAVATPPPPPARVARVDAFGQPLKAASSGDVACPACGRRVAASRFAPHLEKCLGGGRAAATRSALRARS